MYCHFTFLILLTKYLKCGSLVKQLINDIMGCSLILQVVSSRIYIPFVNVHVHVHVHERNYLFLYAFDAFCRIIDQSADKIGFSSNLDATYLNWSKINSLHAFRVIFSKSR
jgi:uncharacterized membrane protein